MKKIFFVGLVFHLYGGSAFCGEQLKFQTGQSVTLDIVPNHGQWSGDFLYRAAADVAMVYLEENAFVFSVSSAADMKEVHAHHAEEDWALKIRSHIWRQEFQGCNPVIPREEAICSYYYNYFTSGVQAGSCSNVYPCRRIVYENLWDGIDLVVYGQGKQFKYEFVIQPGADPNQIAWHYVGLDGLELEKGELFFSTSLGRLKDEAPEAYQLTGNRLQVVPCQYKLADQDIRIEILSYDPTGPLVIDPTLVAATYVDSQAISIGQELWGYHAGFDQQGNIFLVSAPSEPVFSSTPGAAFTSFGGGSFDTAISKFNPDGTQLLWASYLGGSDYDRPSTLLCNLQGEVYLCGKTGSDDFPVTSGAFDTEYNGTSDLFVVRFSPDGSMLLSSTLIGGNLGDGGHLDLPENMNLYNADDIGLALTTEGDIVLGSLANSIDYSPQFIFSSNDLQNNGDAFVFKLSGDLSHLDWCTGLSSTGLDWICDLELRSDGSIVLVGGTTGNDFPVTDDAYSTITGGGFEGWAAILSENGQTLLHSTYFGTSNADELNMVDLDLDGNIWVTGVSNGVLPQSSGVYANSSSFFFIAQLSQSLASAPIITKVGANNSDDEPTFLVQGFIVDACGKIYLSGHGPMESLESYDVSINALSDVGGMYCAVFDAGMADLIYSTLFGGDHAHGGMSMYDQKGVVYQAVCQCSFAPAFEALPDAYDSEQSPSCEAAVFKIDFESEAVVSSFTYSPLSSCLPYQVEFFNWSDSASYQWNFGDGNGWQAIQDSSFIHTFYSSGSQLVQLVAFAMNSCNVWDTLKAWIQVPDTTSSLALAWYYDLPDLCQESVVIPFEYSGEGASSYMWILPNDQEVNNVPQVNVILDSPGNYMVYLLGTDSLCQYVDTLELELHTGPGVEALADIEPQEGGCVPLELMAESQSIHADSLQWYVNGIFEEASQEFEFLFTLTGSYEINLVANGDTGCVQSDTVTFFIEVFPLPEVYLTLPDTLCKEDGDYVITSGTPPGGIYNGPGISGNVFDPSEAGNGLHDISYTYIDANGCTTSVTEQVVVATCTHVNETPKTDLILYPNPTGEVLIMESGYPIMHIQIWNAMGALIYSEDPISPDKVLRLYIHSWASGPYYYSVILGNGTTSTGEFEVVR